MSNKTPTMDSESAAGNLRQLEDGIRTNLDKELTYETYLGL